MGSVDQRTSTRGGPTWEIAELFPNQGAWSVHDYLALNTNRLIEFSDGQLEMLPMPTEDHQLIVAFLYEMLKRFVSPQKLGKALFAPLRVQLREGKFREPDIVFMLAENDDRRGKKFWRGADLVMEVVSEDNPERDLVQKRDEYAQAGISEYWTVDPRTRTIIVHTLDSSAGSYRQAGQYSAGTMAQSVLLNGFTVDVTEVFRQQ
jgi:Uma2 family endonuclease